jgi:hypothetical protein
MLENQTNYKKHIQEQIGYCDKASHIHPPKWLFTPNLLYM